MLVLLMHFFNYQISQQWFICFS